MSVRSGPLQSSEEWVEQFGIFLHRRRVEILREMLSDTRRSPALDVGCGSGLLAEVGLRSAVGVDIRPSKAVTVLASAEYLPFKNDCFDLVVAGEVIEHLGRPTLALQDWTRVLRSGGIMVVSTPNGNLVKPDWNPEHRQTYSPRDMKIALQKHGLRVASVRGIFTGFVSGRRLFKWVPLASAKTLVLRLPIPAWMAYDFFVKAIKGYHISTEDSPANPK